MSDQTNQTTGDNEDRSTDYPRVLEGGAKTDTPVHNVPVEERQTAQRTTQPGDENLVNVGHDDAQREASTTPQPGTEATGEGQTDTPTTGQAEGTGEPAPSDSPSASPPAQTTPG